MVALVSRLKPDSVSIHDPKEKDSVTIVFGRSFLGSGQTNFKGISTHSKQMEVVKLSQTNYVKIKEIFYEQTNRGQVPCHL